MAKENPDDHSETHKPLPHCKALLLCEKVTESQLTDKITLHNLIETFNLRSFPGRSTPFTIFLQVYDGIGRYPITVEVNDLTGGLTIAEIDLDDFDFPERLVMIQMTAPIDSVPLPHPGRYELVIVLDGQPLARQYFVAEVDHVSR
ncbi:MAG TPA: hypothetical protein VG125_16205 [Pirellulales bacterium]|jgi:hypothetical protein|nr:hypothetical protein [Pirellulales bacterium]